MMWKLLYIEKKGSAKTGKVSEVPAGYTRPSYAEVDLPVSAGGRLPEEPSKQEIRILEFYPTDTRNVDALSELALVAMRDLGLSADARNPNRTTPTPVVGDFILFDRA